MEIAFEADPTIYDGRFANNGWLQELPKPITKLTWDNTVIMSPNTAQQLGLSLGSYAHGGEHGGYHMPVVELQLENRSVRAPLWIMPGHAERAVTVYLGHGRVAAGSIGGSGLQTVGFNAYFLRTADSPWFARGLRVVPTNDDQLIACTQQHQLMENRDLVRSATLDGYRAHPDFAADPEKAQREEAAHLGYQPLTLYESYDYKPPKHKWGMVIDLNTCTGCSACVVACQAENNIPVVGKEQVAAGREMHWLRIDRYSRGPAEHPAEFYFQPLPCMHCENAPCEYVCPVEATVHQRRGAERHGLQSLCGHALLLEQLSLQSSTFQFPGVRRLHDRNKADAIQPRRDRPLARGDGKVYILRAAIAASRNHRSGRGSSAGRWRSAHGLPGRLSGSGHRVRRLEHSGQPCEAVARLAARLCASWATTTRVPARAIWRRCVIQTPTFEVD